MMPNYEENLRLVEEEKLLIEEAKAIRKRKRISSMALLAIVIVFLCVATVAGTQLETSETRTLVLNTNLAVYGLLIVGRILYDLHLMRRSRALRAWASDLNLRCTEFYYRSRGTLYGE